MAKTNKNERILAVFHLIFTAVYTKGVQENKAQVEVRAVLISCEPDDGHSVPYENDAIRFEREELYKHSILQNCKKKIALTVKIASDPDLNSGDEYIPIEHVFQGPTTRVRLLNPYVLRLRREPPLQAYKLRKIDTVCGSLPSKPNPRIKRSGKDEIVQEQQNVPHPSENSAIASNEPMITNDDITSSLAADKKLRGSVNLNDKNQADRINYSGGKIKPQKPEPYEVNTKIEWSEDDEPSATNQVKAKRFNNKGEVVREYDMYEIGRAELWYAIQVQLFEKLITSEGKTAWNDLTKGKPARVSSLSPKWTSADVCIVYKSSEWVPREGFTLPVTSLCLLAPVSRKDATELKLEKTGTHYIVVPREDIVAENITKIRESESKLSDAEASTNQPGKQSPRRVSIRSSPALLGDNGAKVSIVNRNGNEYLTLVHKAPYHVQIDLEARADDNQLVHVGCTGRVMTVVADSSRRTRTVLTVQVTNTGLAAARFKVVARECSPELPELLNDKINEKDASFILLAPKHTQSIVIDVPAEIPADVAHCSIALVNGDHQSVAVRDVTIRKGDRCFCVWHCECVCLGEDPKLSCREMPSARRSAAGLPVRECTRLVRAVCYHDVLSLNLSLTAVGVLLTLLNFGILKACLGLCIRCIGTWGLGRLLSRPRKLEHYYEASLRCRTVVYDDDGWPVHPDTHQRTVRLISLPMEFLLNTIFFITVPCMLVYEAMKQLFYRCKLPAGDDSNWGLGRSRYNKCYSSRENIIQKSGTQCRQRRGGSARLQRWMTPEAEKLSSNVLQEALPTRASMIRDYMRPLHSEGLCHGDSGGGGGSGAGPGACAVSAAAVGVAMSVGVGRVTPASCGDSDLDDTEYVLMQMQKSRDSLARSQRKLNGCESSTANK